MDVSQPQQNLETPVKPSTGTTPVAGRMVSEDLKSNDSKVASDSSQQTQGLTFKNQDSLPKLPVPDLESTCQKYLESLAALQSPREQAESKVAVEEFLKSDGPALQERLKNYASSKTSYIEQFCEFLSTDYTLSIANCIFQGMIHI